MLHNGPLTDLQRLWVALFAAPMGSALGGLTAAALDGLVGFTSEVIDVLVPQGQRTAQLEGARFRWSSKLEVTDVHPARRPRRTRLARSLLDSASWARSDGWARAILIAGVQQRLLTTSQLRDALQRRGHCLRHGLMTETLIDIDGGIHSVPEREFSLIVVRSGLPRPTRQVLRRRANGCYYLDAEWAEYNLAVEVQGSHHNGVIQWDADLDRHNEITAGGRRLLHVTSHSVRYRPEHVAKLIESALRAGGWRG